jgi:hypothetical protein
VLTALDLDAAGEAESRSRAANNCHIISSHFWHFAPSLVHTQSIPNDLREKTCSRRHQKNVYLISAVVVVCAREDTEMRFKEALFLRFRKLVLVESYGTSMRSTGEIIGKWKMRRNRKLEIVRLDLG